MEGIVMYKVIHWDEPDNVWEFDCYIDALQFGNSNHGSRYDLIEEDSTI